jgi:hypothetical protein
VIVSRCDAVGSYRSLPSTVDGGDDGGDGEISDSILLAEAWSVAGISKISRECGHRHRAYGHPSVYGIPDAASHRWILERRISLHVACCSILLYKSRVGVSIYIKIRNRVLKCQSLLYSKTRAQNSKLLISLSSSSSEPRHRHRPPVLVRNSPFVLSG